MLLLPRRYSPQQGHGTKAARVYSAIASTCFGPVSNTNRAAPRARANVSSSSRTPRPTPSPRACGDTYIRFTSAVVASMNRRASWESRGSAAIVSTTAPRERHHGVGATELVLDVRVRVPVVLPAVV